MPGLKRVKIPDADQAVLAELYRSSERTLDNLPYTEEFDRLYDEFVRMTGSKLTKHEVWKGLASQRKGKKLARKQRGAT